jgi:dolichol-phosphate mannosyltransferase
MGNLSETGKAVDLSLILPAYNEEESIEQTIREARSVLKTLPSTSEILIIDDGSTDGTPGLLRKLADKAGGVRVLRLTPNSGQSAAIGVGFKNARGKVVVLMDADGQNDPADIPKLLDELKNCDVSCGYRLNRMDSAGKRMASRFANRVRNWVLGENIIDTGCTLKVFKAELVRDLPMWRGMHRFLPTLTRMKGAVIRQVSVNHRPRRAGVSKYSNLGRLRETIWDLWVVRWMQKRYRSFKVEEL